MLPSSWTPAAEALPQQLERMLFITLSPDLLRITKAIGTKGMIDIVIDEKGDVVNATIRQSLNSSFDTLMVRAARQWKYRPFLLNAEPVDIETQITINFKLPN